MTFAEKMRVTRVISNDEDISENAQADNNNNGNSTDANIEVNQLLDLFDNNVDDGNNEYVPIHISKKKKAIWFIIKHLKNSYTEIEMTKMKMKMKMIFLKVNRLINRIITATITITITMEITKQQTQITITMKILRMQ